MRSTYKTYIDDIEAIKDIMDRSTKFLSLSGLSGVLAGSFALVAAYLSYQVVYDGQDYLSYRIADTSRDTLVSLILIGSVTILLSLVSGVWLTTRKARELGQSIYDKQAQRMIGHLAVPLITGGLVCLILLYYGLVGLVAPMTLIFYGLALENASKFAHKSMRYLGWLEILLGLIAMIFIGRGLIFWAIGFGVLHIVYGIVMYMNDRK